jgi:hypothetical protein
VGLVGLGMRLHVGDVERHFHAADHATKHRVFVVQPRGRNDGEKKLKIENGFAFLKKNLE